MKTKEDLEEFIREMIGREDILSFSEEETISAIIGYDDNTNALIYDYDKLVDSFMEHFRNCDSPEEQKKKTEEDYYTDAVEWIDYNTLRSLPYKNYDYIVTNDKGEAYKYANRQEAEDKAKEIDGSVEYVEYVNPIVMRGCADWGDYCAPKPYSFNAKVQVEKCMDWIKDWFEDMDDDSKAIIHMDGFKSSAVVAALCARALGKDRVIGVAIPDSGEGLNDADIVCKKIGIKFTNAPIGGIVVDFTSLGNYYSQSWLNVVPRIRMTVLYAIAESVNGRVANTCSLSENYIGDTTIFGDAAGCFAPISKFTIDEINQLADELGLSDVPEKCHNEAEWGFSYKTLDKFIREDKYEDKAIVDRIITAHFKNVDKMQLVNVPYYDPELPIIA